MDVFDRDEPALDDAAALTEGAARLADAIGSDERRMHVRAYNYWTSLLDGRDYPSIEDLDPAKLEDFGGNSVILDFTGGRENPGTPYIGAAIRTECGLSSDIRSISEVPSRSLLSRLTDHYLQIIANRAPIGFEAEFENQRGDNICYRGILMPFSSDGETIDFIYGVINWKIANSGLQASAPLPQPVEEPAAEAIAPPSAAPHIDQWADGPGHEQETDEEEELEATPLIGDDANLADRLWAARETADAVKAADGRTRSALYRALSYAYDFALASKREPDDYAELLEESGLKAQARAPMTPIVKLVFGIDYDKSRLTEFAAALSYAEREGIADGAFEQLIGSFSGGLKGLVAAERAARRPEPRADTRGEKARTRLRSAPAIALADLDSDDEFTLTLVRRDADGGRSLIAAINDEKLVERALRVAAR